MPENNGHVITARKGLFRKPPPSTRPVAEATGELFRIDPPRTTDEFTARALTAHLRKAAPSGVTAGEVVAPDATRKGG